MTDSDPSDTVTAQDWFCPQCGHEVDVGEKVEPWDCVECGVEMVAERDRAEYVPVEALEDLAEEWKDFAEPAGWDGYSDGVRDATVSCADELQELIEDYE